MTISDLIHELITSEDYTNYIIAIQLPVVLSLLVQSFQVYKHNYKEFKFITIAWGINLLYIFSFIILKHYPVNSELKLVIRIVFDFSTMYFFFFAVVDSVDGLQFLKLKKIKKGYFICILGIAGAAKAIPGSLHIIPYVHVRNIPAALVDFFVLFLLSLYFRQFAKRFHQKQFLFYVTLLYAILQFISILQPDLNEPKQQIILHVTTIDNVGFGLGTILKTAILIFFSYLFIDIIEIVVAEEKE